MRGDKARRVVCPVLLCAFLVVSTSGQKTRAQTGVSAEIAHGLLAHDINGFALDMTLQEVQAKAGKPLRHLSGGDFDVTLGDKSYDFGFSILGRLYRIDYEANLGNFIPDAAYGRNLARRLTEKYGPPQSSNLPGGAAFWQFTEQCRTPEGQVLTCETESLSVSLFGGWGSPMKLAMKLMDFRIMRRDIARANAGPRSKAEGATTF